MQSGGAFRILYGKKLYAPAAQNETGKEARRLKRIIGLILACCMLFIMGMPAAAAEPRMAAVSFSDRDAIRNDNEVWMLVDLGLISGYGDGTFRPQNGITREETAKLIAMLCTDEPAAENAPVFLDTADSWAADFISYCASRGIIAGSNGLFRPKDGVTAQELAKMLLVVLGEDPARYVGAEWADAVNADAMAFGIYSGYSKNYAAPLCRDDACLLIYNAMQCSAVVHPEQEGVLRYELDELMNPKTYLEVRYDLVRYTAILTANECADLSVSGGKLEPGYSRLAGYSKLFAVSTDLGLLGRNVNIYMRGDTVVGVPCYAAGELYYTFADSAELMQLLSEGVFSLDESAQYYYNFDAARADILDQLSPNAKITVIDHTGDMCFDIVLVTNCMQATVTSLHPLTVSAGAQQNVEVAPFNSVDSFAVGQQVLYIQICGQGYIRPLA